MKLLLFDPTDPYDMPPLGLGYLASYLRTYLNFDQITIKMARKNQLKIVESVRPDVLGITCYTNFYKSTLMLASEVKNRLDIPIIVGGPHVTLMPYTLPKEFDIGVVGEGEQTLLELMSIFLDRMEFDPKALEKVKGVVYHNGNSLKMTPHRELIKPLDKIPYPARDLFDMDRFLRSCGRFSYSSPDRLINILTARGCPYKCVFCASTNYYPFVRYHSPRYIVDEILTLAEKYKPKVIHISDDVFTTNRKRLAEIVKLIEDEKLNEKVRFWVNTRANELNEEICELLKRMGTFHVMMGFESCSPKILGYLKRNTVTVEQNRNAVLLAKKYGFRVEGSFMIGSPGETREDMMQTYEFIEKYPIDCFGVHITVPFPGTELWEDAKNQGKVRDDMDFDSLFTFDPLGYLKNPQKYVVLTDEVNEEEFVKMYAKFHRLVAKRGRYAKVKITDFLKPTLWRKALFSPLHMMRHAMDRLKAVG